jgi:hypothetical protein
LALLLKKEKTMAKKKKIVRRKPDPLEAMTDERFITLSLAMVAKRFDGKDPVKLRFWTVALMAFPRLHPHEMVLIENMMAPILGRAVILKAIGKEE